jgi:Stress responsive A/B Barrel Domain
VIYHCIRMRIKPDVPKDLVLSILARMKAIGENATHARPLVIGPDYGGEYEYGAMSMVESLEDYEAMMRDPAHLEIDRIGLPLVDKFTSFDIVDDPDPELGKKIAEIHRRRYADVPEVEDLVMAIGSYSGSAAPERPLDTQVSRNPGATGSNP